MKTTHSHLMKLWRRSRPIVRSVNDMGNLCATPQESDPKYTSGGAGAGFQMAKTGSSAGGRPGQLAEDLAAHYQGSGVRYFVAHLVSEDLSKARPIIVEVSTTGIAFAHPKAPFQTFKTFDMDEIVGWKASEVEFSFVSLKVRGVHASDCRTLLSAIHHSPSRPPASHPRPTPVRPRPRVLHQDSKGKTQGWSVATENGATIAATMDMMSKTAFESSPDLGQVSILTGASAI